MPPRKRAAGNRDLPPNLYSQTKGGVTYYRYLNQKTQKFHGMGTDKVKAVRAAKLLNARLASEDAAVETLVSRVEGRADTLGVFIDRFVGEIMPTLRHKDGSAFSGKSTAEFQRMYRVIRQKLGHLQYQDVTRAKVAAFLDSFPATASNRYRTRLSVLFTHAIAKGLMDANPAELTIAKPEEVKRRRLTLEWYMATRGKAPQWLQNAMDLSLQTLLRREDVVAVQWADIRDGRLHVVHEKTKRHESAKVRITISQGLQSVLDRCRDNIPSPYIIHRRPMRKRAREAGSADHWTRIKPEMVSRAFQDARDATGLFDAMPAEERPTFHEVRALGRKLYEDVGQDVKALGGWADDKMPAKYLEGHDRWIDAAAGLDLGKY